MSEVTITNIVGRWSGLERPLFKGKLIDADGCKCAQGDVLSCAGYSDDDLRRMEQSNADIETARVLGISRAHSVLLRYVNDQADGAPQIVLSNPEQIIGDKAPLLLAFWLHLDQMTAAAGYAARDAAWDAAGYAAGYAAGASSEIQGLDILERGGRQLYFLTFFGFKTWDDVRNLVKA